MKGAGTFEIVGTDPGLAQCWFYLNLEESNSQVWQVKHLPLSLWVCQVVCKLCGARCEYDFS